MPSIALERRLAGTDVLPLKGSMAAPLPEHVREAVLAAIDEHAVTPPSRGHLALREAIAREPAGARRSGERDPGHERRHARAQPHVPRAARARRRSDRADSVLLLRRPDRAGRRRLRAGAGLGSGGDRACGDAELARSRPDEPEQPGRLPPVAGGDRRAAGARLPARPAGDHGRGVRALHPRGRARLGVGRAERDPDPQPRQEPRDARVADRLRRSRAGGDRRLPARAGVGRDSRQPRCPARSHGGARRPAGLAGRGRARAIAAIATQPTRRSPSTRS